MAPGTENLSESVSIMTQRQLDKFVRDYMIPTELHPVLPAKDKIIYPFLPDKFPLYTRVCNFAYYRVPFSKFLVKVLRFFRVHLCQVNPFGLSRINHFEVSCRALNRKPDLNVLQYFYEFITAGDWYTLPTGRLAQGLIDNRSPIRPLPDHLLLLGRVCFVWSRGDRDWPVIRKKSEREEMSLRDALKVPNFSTLDFDFEQLKTRPLLQRLLLLAPDRVWTELEGEDVDSDLEIRELDQALMYRPSSASIKGKAVSLVAEPKGLLQKRKADVPQIHSSTSLPIPKLTKKAKKSSSHSSDNIMTDLDEHLSGGKSSREEATMARSAPTPCWCMRLSTSSCIESCIELVRPGHENQESGNYR
ncbi:hypothetical protein Hanom_Chr02g00122251 [Helianthus anomalus]